MAAARAHPERLALETAGTGLTYARLLDRVAELAALLGGRGVRPGDTVAVLMDRGPDLVAAVLAASARGAAWLTVDPAHPPLRTDSILRQADPRCVVTDPANRARAERRDGPPPLVLPPAVPGTEPAGPGAEPAAVGGLVAEAAPDDLAYLVFTSGSTGAPKGVRVPQGGLAPLAAGLRDRLGLGPDDRVLQFSSTGFDAFVGELLMAFPVGAALCLDEWDALLVGAPLEEALRVRRITAVLLSPTAHGALDPRRLPGLRVLVSGSEPLTRAAGDRWSAPGRRVFNAYGPSEATCMISIGEVGADGGEVDAGRLLPGFALVLADRDLAPVAPGEAGELVVFGGGVALGYLGAPDAGSAAFRSLPHPDTGRARRAYRTGDLARTTADGRIVVYGRIGDQVKIRGHRVEPGEIDGALELHPEVALARTHGVRDPAGRPALASYVVPTGAGDPRGLPARLRVHLADRLLPAMIPATIRSVDRIPTTVNGKTDWSALMRSNDTGESGTARPSASAERARAVLERVLGENRLGEGGFAADSDFFLSGGHSLLVANAAELLREEFGVEVPLRIVVRRRTAVAIAEWIDAELRDRPSGAAPEAAR
nr:non-ribosomal peptide synthetase [Kitasatospora sp. SID7827]